MKILFILFSLLLAAQVQATTLFSENFNDQPDWNSCTEGNDPTTALNASTSGHTWETSRPPQPYGGACDGAAVKYSQVDSAYAHGGSGKGLRFNLHSTRFTITAFSDYSGTVAGTVKVTTAEAHYYTSSQIQLKIEGTTNYNEVISTYTVLDGTSFYFTHSWDGDDATGEVFYNYAQESCWFAEENLSQSILFLGFWFEMSKTSIFRSGTNQVLKLSRIYSSDGGNSIIPEWVNKWDNAGAAEMWIVSAGAGGTIETGYNIADTVWHYYIFEFGRGNNSNDGVVRLWVDGVLEYETTTFNWDDTGTVFEMMASFPYLQGNLSGGYDDGALTCTWDDYIWATTKAEVEAFLGTSGGTATFGAGTGTCTFGAGTGSTTF